MATTINQDPGQFEAGYDVGFPTLAASTQIPAGTLAMNDAGAAKVFTSAGYVGGAKLLGVANKRYVNAEVTSQPERQTYRRGTPMLIATKSGDEPTQSDVGDKVYVSDNFTVQKTAIVNGLAVDLLWLSSDSKIARILVP